MKENKKVKKEENTRSTKKKRKNDYGQEKRRTHALDQENRMQDKAITVKKKEEGKRKRKLELNI